MELNPVLQEIKGLKRSQRLFAESDGCVTGVKERRAETSRRH